MDKPVKANKEQKGAPHFSFTPTFIRWLYVAVGWKCILATDYFLWGRSREEMQKSRRRGRVSPGTGQWKQSCSSPLFALDLKMGPIRHRVLDQILESFTDWPFHAGTNCKDTAVLNDCVYWRCVVKWDEVCFSSEAFMKLKWICLVRYFWNTKWKDVSSLHLCWAFFFSHQFSHQNIHIQSRQLQEWVFQEMGFYPPYTYFCFQCR